ncbi:MAG: uroporphyrinogen decarboxylase [Chloroflexi bacterium RIFOXYC12_FULL_59_14]|nr:MAG: uroporphyrinogen decarboxylase [Chloroflexi bacterium RIFOXYC12_FULL_59_14]
MTLAQSANYQSPITDNASSFLRACHRQPTDTTPVWFMRQAGRYMPEYRVIREKYSLLEICYQPELAAEVTLQPVRALGVDAAILFADILLPAIPLGVGLEFAKGEGPVLHHPVHTMDDVKKLRPVNPETDLGYVLDAIRILRGELKDVPLIGFCGAPFTVASYIIEGGSSREFLKTKTMMYSDPQTWHALMEKLSVVLTDYLVAQIHAGAQTVQVFDSWVGALSPQDYETFVLPYSQKVLSAAKAEGVPVIHFGTNTTTLLHLMKRAGGDVIGLDWRVPLDDGWSLLGDDVAVQGNLDPAVLFAPLPEIKARVHDILRRANGKPGHIFNLGHGILQHTPVDNVKAVVDMVHEFSSVVG